MWARLTTLFVVAVIFVTSCAKNNYNKKETPAILAVTKATDVTDTIIAARTSNPTRTFTIYERSPTPDLCRVNNNIQEISIPAPDSRPPEDIVADIFGKWLTNFKDCPASSAWKIDDYRILDASAYALSPRIFIGIEYSIKPERSENVFMTGNGVINEETGWIEYKFICYELILDEAEYKVGKGGTIC